MKLDGTGKDPCDPFLFLGYVFFQKQGGRAKSLVSFRVGKCRDQKKWQIVFGTNKVEKTKRGFSKGTCLALLSSIIDWETRVSWHTLRHPVVL